MVYKITFFTVNKCIAIATLLSTVFTACGQFWLTVENVHLSLLCACIFCYSSLYEGPIDDLYLDADDTGVAEAPL